jgi:hypothetical protein
LVRFPHHDQAIRLVVGKGPQQDRVDQSEQRRRDCDSGSEDRRHRDGEAGGAGQKANGLRDVMAQTGDDNVGNKRRPRCRQARAAAGARIGQGAACGVMDGGQVARLTRSEAVQQEAIASRRQVEPPRAPHVRLSFRGVRFASASCTIVCSRRISASSACRPRWVSAK